MHDKETSLNEKKALSLNRKGKSPYFIYILPLKEKINPLTQEKQHP